MSTAMGEFTVSLSTAEDSKNAELLGRVVQIVNDAYSRGEEGMWQGEACRTNAEEMRSHLTESKIILAYTSTGLLVGSIFVNPHFDESLGELGMLCVALSHLRKGLGNVLINAAELHCLSKGCKTMRLELLTPANFVHPVKAWLDLWYSSLGYVKGMPEDFGLAFPRVQPLLACDCVFTAYLKAL
jgi:GNAT superfamily N-acetyltransferase